MHTVIYSYKGCNEDEFECEDGACVKIDQLCDGSRDCTNGEDEVVNCNDYNATYTDGIDEVYTESPPFLGTTTDYCK